MYVIFLALLAAASGITTPNEHSFKTIYSWKQIDFNFPNESIRNAYLASGGYIPENNMPLGLNVWQNKMFITVPRWRNGVPFNLNYFQLNESNSSPILSPYPDFESNNINSSDGIVSIFRVRIDACDRLWGIDTGVDDILGETAVLQPTRLVVIDLKTDKVIRRYNLKESDQKADSFFADLAIDVDKDSCDNAFAYLSDLGGYGLVVYSWATNDSWRINHNYFYFDPLYGDYNISGYNFQWTDGVFGLALSPPKANSYRTLYFHAMSGITEFQVSTEILRDEALAKGNNYYSFAVSGSKGPKTQGTSSVIDQETGIDYFTQVNRNGIGCWDTAVTLDPTTFLLAAQDNETMVFPNDLVIDPLEKRLLVLSDNLPKFHYGGLDPTRNSYFITAAKLQDLSEICKQGSI
ncbi:protein yellow-like [Prorops nasuta]|uniref:protein yellow-like n=1 Tax=Prorops nasuta TaxID=863751 RepID=UPI0034CD1FD2